MLPGREAVLSRTRIVRTRRVLRPEDTRADSSPGRAVALEGRPRRRYRRPTWSRWPRWERRRAPLPQSTRRYVALMSFWTISAVSRSVARLLLRIVSKTL